MHLRDWKVTSQSLAADGGHGVYLHYLSLRYTPPTWRAYLTLFSCHRPPHWAGPRKTLRNCPAQNSNVQIGKPSQRTREKLVGGDRDSGLGRR